jgi:hypothetical protein
MTLVEHVDRLRRLASGDPETSLLQLAMINVMEEVASTVDRLTQDDQQ